MDAQPAAQTSFAREAAVPLASPAIVMQVKGLNVSYPKRPKPVKLATRLQNLFGGKATPPEPKTSRAVHDVSFDVYKGQVLALMGPSGCGKSTVLRALNRMNDVIPGCVVEGDITLNGENIYGRDLDVVELRKSIGMIFQRPNPFPKSIFDNIAYGPRIHGLALSKGEVKDTVERCLRDAALWDEVKDRLGEPGTSLSGGQQQRLCIARAIANKPDVLLMDEPCSALDPIATAQIENLIDHLKATTPIVIVTHSVQQAMRVSDRIAVFNLGRLEELDETKVIQLNPKKKFTQDLLMGHVG